MEPKGNFYILALNNKFETLVFPRAKYNLYMFFLHWNPTAVFQSGDLSLLFTACRITKNALEVRNQRSETHC